MSRWIFFLSLLVATLAYAPLNAATCSDADLRANGFLRERFFDSSSKIISGAYPHGNKIGYQAYVVGCNAVEKDALVLYQPSVTPLVAADPSTWYPATYDQTLMIWDILTREWASGSLTLDYAIYLRVFNAYHGYANLQGLYDAIAPLTSQMAIPPVISLHSVTKISTSGIDAFASQVEGIPFDARAASEIQKKLNCSIPYRRLSINSIPDQAWRSWGILAGNLVHVAIDGLGADAYEQTKSALGRALLFAKRGGSSKDRIIQVTLYIHSPSDSASVLLAYDHFFSDTPHRPTRNGPFDGYYFLDTSTLIEIEVLAWAGDRSDFQAKNNSRLYGHGYSDAIQAGEFVYTSNMFGCKLTSNRSRCDMVGNTAIGLLGNIDATQYRAQMVQAQKNVIAALALFGVDWLDIKVQLIWMGPKGSFVSYAPVSEVLATNLEGTGVRPFIREDVPSVGMPSFVPSNTVYGLGTLGIDLHNYVIRGLDPGFNFCTRQDGTKRDIPSCPINLWRDLGGRESGPDDYYEETSLLGPQY